MVMRRFWLSLAVLGLALASAPFAGAEYPDKPITMIVAFAPGGGSDVLARRLAPLIARQLGPNAEINVVSIPEAGGEKGFAALARAPADGSTIGLINTPSIVAIPIERKALYEFKDIDPLVAIVYDPEVWVVRDDRFSTLGDLVAFAKANPDAVTLGTSGINSDDHLSLLSVQRRTGVRIKHIPFSGAALAEKALIARKVMVVGENLSEALRLKAHEPVRILGIMSQQRWPIAPEVPTFAEQGIEVFGSAIRGIAAPAGMPPGNREKLVNAILKAASDPAFVQESDTIKTYEPLHILGPEAFIKELQQIDEEIRLLWSLEPWL